MANNFKDGTEAMLTGALVGVLGNDRDLIVNPVQDADGNYTREAVIHFQAFGQQHRAVIAIKLITTTAPQRPF